MKWLELKVPPLLLTLIFLIDLGFVHWLEPDAIFTFPFHRTVGAVIFALGILICGLAVRQFRIAQTTFDPRQPHSSQKLITTGLFKFTRNPMYVAFLLIILGSVIFLANTIGLMHPIIFVLYLHYFQIKPEERAMLSRFGEDYMQYLTKTTRWVFI